MVTDRSLHRLKKESSGFYGYAAKQIYISKNPFLSSDVRNVGFFLRKNAEKVNKAKFTTTMMQRLADFPLSHADSDRYNEAKEKLPFAAPSVLSSYEVPVTFITPAPMAVKCEQQRLHSTVINNTPLFFLDC